MLLNFGLLQGLKTEYKIIFVSVGDYKIQAIINVSVIIKMTEDQIFHTLRIISLATFSKVLKNSNYYTVKG